MLAKTIQKRNQDGLAKLSRYLTLNVIGHSVDKLEHVEDALATELNLQDKIDISTFGSSRNILIIGAGASFNANNQIPTAESFIKQIKAKFSKSELDKKLDYLERVTNLPQDEFETVMLACSKLDNTLVLDELQKSYDYKHIPNLFYEIVGHLFKHRFIDIIIDFNFDEILSNVIEQEMGRMDYDHIISDGDLKDELDELMLNHRLRKPIYIKPHGTISHPSSLRFNKEHYYALPIRIADLLTQLLVAKYKTNNQDHFLNLNLITVGFGMQSMEFNFLLKDALKKRKKTSTCEFFIFDVKSENSYKEKLLSTAIYKGKIKPGINYIKINPAHPEQDLEALIFSLWKSISNNFRQKSRLLRNINRHLIISKIFQNKETSPLRIFRTREELIKENKYKSQSYLLARIYVEICILVINSDGFINLSQIKESRVGQYYLLLKKVYTILGKSDAECKTLPYFLNYFGFRYYKDFVKDTFLYENFINNYSFVQELLDKLFYKLDNLKNDFTEEEQKKLNREVYPLNLSEIPHLKDLFQALAKNPTWEVKPDFEEYKISKFKNVSDSNLLHTDFRFNLQRLNLFKQSDDEWNVLLSITKKAGFLTEDTEIMDLLKNNKKFVCLVLSKTDVDNIDKVYDSDLQGCHCIYHQEDNSKFRKMPWWLHNQHLHVFLRFKKMDPDLVPKRDLATDTDDTDFWNNFFIEHYSGGIFYQRRLLSRKINPVYFDSTHVDNLKELVDVFINYWARAKYHSGEQEESGNAIKDKLQFLGHKYDLFKLIIDNLYQENAFNP